MARSDLSHRKRMGPQQKDIGRLIFKYRSYTPIPFLIVMVVFTKPTLLSLIIGVMTIAGGEGVRFLGVAIAGSETRTTGNVGGSYLITNGPFAYVRNPLYLGNMMIYAGVGIMSMALFPWLVIIALMWFYVQYRLIVASEEEYLSKQFGEEFTVYKKHVGRFFPRMRKYVAPNSAPRAINRQAGLTSERRTLQAIMLVTLAVVTIYVFQHWRM